MSFIGISFHIESAFQTLRWKLDHTRLTFTCLPSSPSLGLEIDHLFCLFLFVFKRISYAVWKTNQPIITNYIASHTGTDLSLRLHNISSSEKFLSLHVWIKRNHVERNHTSGEMKTGERMQGSVRCGGEQRCASLTEKGEMTDWTWEDNEEWNTVQLNVISHTLAGEALLPFLWDCYYRWIFTDKDINSSAQHFLDFAAIRAGFENPALKVGDNCSHAALASRWRLNGEKELTYISSDQDCLLWTFLINAGFNRCDVIFHHSSLWQNWST